MQTEPQHPSSNFSDSRLNGHYSTLDIALLAAKCPGSVNEEKIENAIQLLATTENIAAISSDKRKRNLKLALLAASEPHLKDGAPISLKSMSFIFEDVQLHEKSNKMLRSSLAVELCRIVGCTGDRPYANSLFRQWIAAYYETFREYMPDFSSSIEFQRSFESGDREPLINEGDEEWVTTEFFRWLVTRNEVTQRALIRSRRLGAEGRFVRPATRGAERREDGRFSE